MQFLVVSSRRTDRSRCRMGRGADGPGACRIVTARDEAEERAWLDTLPPARAGLLGFKTVPLRPRAGFGV